MLAYSRMGWLTMVELQVKGLMELRAKLGKVKFSEVFTPIMTAATVAAKGKIAKYPPSSAANSSGQKRWYERGYGSKWRVKDGSIHGRKTSQMLGKSWTTKVEDGGMRGIVGTKVTYAPWVQDRNRQASYHRRRGWVTVQDVAEKYGAEIVAKLERAIKALLG